MNAPSLGTLPPGAPEVTAADFSRISGGDDVALACAIAGGTWAVLRTMAPELGLAAEGILSAEGAGTDSLTAERRQSLLQEGYALIRKIQ